MGNPAKPVTYVNAIAAVPGLASIEMRSTLSFLNLADRNAFLVYLGISGGVPASVAAKYRFKSDGSFQLWNANQSAFQTITISGAADDEELIIGAADADETLPTAAIPWQVDGKYRFKVDGTFELWNADQSAWQPLSVAGAATDEEINIGAADS